MGKDYYDILGIPRSAEAGEIRTAYLKLAKEWHPDVKKTPADKDVAKAKFQDISEAFEVLSHPTRKKIYDRGGEEALTAGGKRTTTGQTPNRGIPPNSANRLAAQFFGYGIQGLDPSTGMPLGGNNIPTKMGVPGFNVTGYNNGTTVVGPNGIQTTTYSRSQARPQKEKKRPVLLPLECTLEELYTGCDKTVTWDAYEEGEHITKEVTVTVKPGWGVGNKIDIDDERDEVTIIITEKEHPHFTRRKEDLHYTCCVTLTQALCGEDIIIPKIMSDKNIKIRFGKPVNPGYTYEIEGAGMPVKNSNTRGKLVVTFTVKFPTDLTPEQKDSIREILGRA